jgi:hypothetical protein
MIFLNFECIKKVEILGVDMKNSLCFLLDLYGYDGSNPMLTCKGFCKKELYVTSYAYN